MLKVQNLSIGYGQALMKNISFELSKGSLVAILGRNGTGKTTLLKTLMGFIAALDGDILIEHQPTAQISTQQLARKISIVNTERIRMNYFLVSDFIGLGRFPYTNFIGQLSDTDKNIIENTVQVLSIEHLTSKYLSQLSDGELQKVLIARALVQNTPIVLLDEPTTHLDLVNRFNIFQLLKKLTTDKLIVLSTHEVELALDLADYIILMDKTEPIKVGTSQEFIDKRWIETAFTQEGVVFDKDIRRFRYDNEKGS